MYNVLVTGGSGFVGKHLVKKLFQEGYGITIIDNNLSKGYKCGLDWIYNNGSNKKKISFYKVDIRKEDSSISDILRQENIDICIHLAAKVSVEDSITKPDETIDVNVKGTLNVLEACSIGNVKSFIFASSAAVYGEPKRLPIKEYHTLKPLSPYGQSKAIGESLVSLFANSQKIPHTISLRFFNIYGEGQSLEYAGVISKFAERLYNRLSPIIYGNGENTRDFISINDAVTAILLTIESIADSHHHKNKGVSTSAIFNVGTGTPISINDLAKMMIKICDLDLTPIYHRAKKGDIRHSYADTMKSKSTLKFTAMEKLESGLTKLLKKEYI
jgi:UDP-glucose 4-epimerase